MLAAYAWTLDNKWHGTWSWTGRDVIKLLSPCFSQDECDYNIVLLSGIIYTVSRKMDHETSIINCQLLWTNLSDLWYCAVIWNNTFTYYNTRKSTTMKQSNHHTGYVLQDSCIMKRLDLSYKYIKPKLRHILLHTVQ